MEILAYITLVLLIFISGVYCSRYQQRNYGFQVFSLKALGLMLVSVVAWALTVYLYEPGTAIEPWVEVMAGLFVLGLGVVLPIYLLIQNIKQSNFFWGLVAFVYQLMACAAFVVFILLVFLRLNDD